MITVNWQKNSYGTWEVVANWSCGPHLFSVREVARDSSVSGCSASEHRAVERLKIRLVEEGAVGF